VHGCRGIRHATQASLALRSPPQIPCADKHKPSPFRAYPDPGKMLSGDVSDDPTWKAVRWGIAKPDDNMYAAAGRWRV